MSNETSRILFATVPTAPKTLSATSGNTIINLIWVPPANDKGTITNYRIYRSNAPSSEVFLVMIGNYLNYTDTGLTNGQTYYYVVTAVNGVGEGPQSNEAMAIPATLPSAPRNLNAVASNAQITLTWTAPSSDGGRPILNYTIYRGTTAGGETYLTRLGNVLTYLDAGLINGQTYYYKVSAVTAKGEGPQSNESMATPATIPGPPQNLVASPGISQIGLTWSAPSSDGGWPITGYKVYRGMAPGSGSLLTILGNVLAYSDLAVSSGQIYYYKVSAVNGIGEGQQSNEASATSVGVPSAPEGLSALAGSSQIDLAWAAPSSDGGSPVTGYKIYRGTTAGGENLLTTVGDVLAYLDGGLTDGQTYYYKVSAVNANGEGPLSNEAWATPSSLPSAPTGLAAVPGASHVILSWSAPTSDGGSPITNYSVYRGINAGGETLLATIGNLLTFTDTGLTNGQTYFYEVSAINIKGEGPRSNEASATPKTVPSSPVLVSAAPGDQQVVLGWSAPSSDGGSPVTGYQVLRGSMPGGEALLTALGSVLTYTDTGLTNGQTYYYEIKAVNSVGAGAPSNELSAMPSGPPSAPRNLQASSGDAFINLTWTVPLNDGGRAITNYQVWRALASGAETFHANAGLRLWFNDTGLSNGQTYYYIVKAENSQGLGPSSNEASAAPHLGIAPPTAPQSLSASRGNAQVVLTWSAPVSDGGAAISNYRVYRGTSSGSETLLTTLSNVLTYTNAGLTNGQTYYYKVSAVNSVGEGPQSNEASATPSTVPTAPQGLLATPGNAQVALSWSAPASNGGSSVTNYNIYRGTSPGAESLLTTLGNVLTYTNTGLTNGQTYYYKVSAVNANGEGALSAEASSTPSTLPSAPQNLAAAFGNSQASLTWSAPSSDGGSPITGYVVYRGNSPGGESLLTSLGNVLSYVDIGLTNGQAYYYKVSAANSNGEGARSNEASTTPMTVPSPPTNLVAVPGNAQVVLTWSAPSVDGGSPITGYVIYRGNVSGNESILTTLGNVLTYTDAGLTNGLTYIYMVGAINLAGQGGLSDEASATPSSLPSAPEGPVATPGNAQVALAWAPPVSDGGSPITGYRIYRGTSSGGEAFLTSVGNVLAYQDSGLTNGQTYFYRLSAVNANGEGVRSSEVSATPTSMPTEPRALMATAGNANVTLAWSAPASDGGSPITNYTIYRGLASGTEVLLARTGNILSYLDEGLTYGQTYYYRVSAWNKEGEGALSNEASATVANVPSAPQGLVAASGYGRVNLTWSQPSYDGGSQITGYNMYRGNSSGNEALLANLGPVLSYTDEGLANGQTYYYKVSAVNGVGEGPMSNESLATPATVPSMPLSLTASTGDGEVHLAWQAPSGDGGSAVTNYSIYRGIEPGAEAFLIQIGDVLSYTDAGLTNGQTYYYFVRAVNGMGEGAPSNEASAVPASVPSAPVNLTATGRDGRVDLGWAAPLSEGGSSITNYTIYRGTAAGEEDLLAIIGDALNYSDAGLINGQTYYYRISASSARGEGPLSNEASATPMSVPSAPWGLSAVPGDAVINLTWEAPVSDGGSQITGYLLYRGTVPGEGSLLVTLGDVLFYADAQLTNGQAYYYRVSASNPNGEGPSSDEASAVPRGSPSAPLGLRALPGDHAVDLNWSAPHYAGPGSLGYRLYRDGVEIWNGTSLSYRDYPLEKGQQRSYQVAAWNSIGQGPSSDAVPVVPNGLPDAPWGILAEPGDGQAELSWSPGNYSGPGMLAFHLFRDGELIWNGASTSYLDPSLSNGREYAYLVASSNDLGWSENSSLAFATPQGPPTMPLGLQARAEVGAIQLNWSAPTYSGPGTTTYLLFRDGAMIWSGEGLGYLDSGLDGQEEHSYAVAASNSVGEGPSSASVRAIPVSAPPELLPYQALVAFTGFACIAALPVSYLALQMYRRRYVLAVSLMPEMRCPNCGVTLPAGSKGCPACGVRYSWKRIIEEER